MSDLIVAAIFTLIGAALGSIAAALGSWLTYRSRHRELDVKMIELAVGLLTQKPEDSTMPLRNWAVDLLDHYSEVKLSPETKAALRQNALPELPGFFVGASFLEPARQHLRGAGAVGPSGEKFETPTPSKGQ